MAHTINIPFFAFKVQLSEDTFLQIPLSDTEALRINEPMYLLAGRYAEKFQKEVLNKGDFKAILKEYLGDDFQPSNLTVSFPASKDNISYPDFDLSFAYYFLEQSNGYWGVVPTIGVDGFGEEQAILEKNLIEAIRLEFLKNRRLESVREIVSAIWEDKIELEKSEILLKFPTLKDLELLEGGDNEEWLPKVAKEITIHRQIVYGREKELDRITKILKGKFTRNLLLVGASGVGKTALIWETVFQKNKRKIKGTFWETTAATLIKELTQETGWQDNLSKVCQEIARKGAILYVNNLMELFEVGKYQGNDVSIAEYLLPYISRGEVTLISECSGEELARIQLNNPNYLSAFQVVHLETPKKNIEKIIIKKVNDLASKRKIEISQEAIRETLRLNQRFTPYSGLPGKPIRFLESVLINRKNFKENTIDRSTIIRAFCEETGMPLFMVDPSIPMDVEKTRRNFNHNVFGQEKAVDSIVNVLSSVKTALTHIGKPIASFLFVGPTGVGKTELAKVLAQFMFGGRDKLIRFDMSEFADPYAVARLTGASFNSDGLLTSAVHQTPFCVLLFDEIEKAHANFYDLLLQLLSEGRLTDSRGKLVNFCSTIIIMTSNIGASNLQGNRISLKKGMDTKEVTTHFLSAVQQFFKPELYNRIDEVIPFAPLSSDTIRYVVEREINLFKQLEGIQYRRLSIELKEEVFDFLALKGYNPKYGARQLQRAIQEQLTVPLSKALNIYDDSNQLIIEVAVQDDALDIQIEADPLGMDLMMEELERCSQTDIVSDMRRAIHRLDESNIYINLKNKLQELERFKHKKPKQFWNDQARGKRYTHLLQLQQGMQTLSQEIVALEQDLSLAYMNIAPYTSELEEKEKKWRSDFLAFKINLCIHLRPSFNQCWVGLFGKPPMQQFELYKKILQEKGWSYSFKTIWYREALYSELIETKEKDALKSRYKRKQYVEIPFTIATKHKFKPPEKGDILVGIILKINYPCIYLFLKNEGGLHKWKTEDKKGKRTIVQVSNQEIKPPDGIHKETFYTEVPARRDYELERMSDKLTKQHVDIQKGDYSRHLIPILEEAFKQNLAIELS